MVSDESKSVIARSKALYEVTLKSDLEASRHGEYVAIEPDSGSYYVAATFDDAVRAAKAEHPDRLTHTIRIGHAGAFSFDGVK